MRARIEAASWVWISALVGVAPLAAQGAGYPELTRDVELRLAMSAGPLTVSADAAAEDLAQDVLLRMHVSLPGFRGDAELSTWLYRVTLNLCRDHQRGAKRRDGEIPVSDALDASTLRIDPTPDTEVDRDRARAAVRAAIDRLPKDQKEAVVLRFMDDLPYAEIARITGAPPGTVASRVFRALERLGRELEPRHMEVVT